MRNPFLDYLPHIDIHGYSKEEAAFKVNEFINDNIKMGKLKIVIIHGIGQGILKKEINLVFSKDKRISKMYGDVFNLGITILELKDMLI